MHTRWIIGFWLVLLSLGSGTVWAGTYSGGDGTAGNPYRIATAADLIELAQTAADWSAHFRQIVNITFDEDETRVDWDGDGVLEWGEGDNDTAGFLPIGGDGEPFSGTYDGQGRTIANLYIHRPEGDYLGLFGCAEKATIEQVTLRDSEIVGYGYVGGLVGYNDNGTITECAASGVVIGSLGVSGLVGVNDNATITDCTAAGSVFGLSAAGGLAGFNINATITDCAATGAVVGGECVGGLVGLTNAADYIRCSATGAVMGNMYVGGLLGLASSADVTACFATGAVTGTQAAVGGLVGAGSAGTIINSYATGSVVAAGVYAGGLVGLNSATLINCYATGSVMAAMGVVGGLVGGNDAVAITNCYATGQVGGGRDTGGLVGSNGSGGSVAYSYYDTITTGQSDAGKGIALTTAEFADRDSFDSSWNIDAAGGPDEEHPWLQRCAPRPYLYWQAHAPRRCAAAAILGTNDPRLGTLRIFRDRFLSGSVAGRTLIGWYYGSDLESLFASDRTMQQAGRTLLLGVMPLVERMVGN